MLKQAEVGSYYGGIVCVGMQLDLTTLIAIQWLVPAILCTTGTHDLSNSSGACFFQLA
jgi:hypothetical protein